MALLWCDGFDGQTSRLPGAYSSLQPFNQSNYTTGRFGTGSAMLGQQATSTMNEMYTEFSSAKTTLFTGVAVKNGAIGQASSDAGLFNFYSVTGTAVLNLRVGATTSTVPGRIQVARGVLNVAGTILGTTSTVMSLTAWTFIEMKVVCGTGTSGSVIVRQNGVETLNLPGIDTGSTSLTGIGLCQRIAGGAANYGWASAFDDWWVCDDTGAVNNTYLGDVRVLTLVPVGAGSSTQFVPSTGSNWSCVDEIPPVTTDYVASTAPGLKDLYDYTVLGSGYQDIKGARLVSYAAQGDAGLIKGRNICKSGATTGTGVDNAMSATAQVFSTIYETDPNTSGAWTNTNLNAAEFGWEVRS